MPRRKRRNTGPNPLYIMIGGGLLLIVAVILLVNRNNSVASEDIPYPEIARVSIENARAALESGDATLLDVRSADAFAGMRIAGEVNIPVAELGARLDELDPQKWIIPYCT
jgi:3-mercaptopyruvate sulfurtransferase SseA